LPGRPGDRHPRRHHDRRRQPGGRRAVCDHRPPHPSGSVAMSAISRAATLTFGARLSTFRISGFPYISTSILVGFAILAIFAAVIAPHSPEIGSLGLRFKPPAWQQGGTSTYLLGTDHLGRDVLSRLIFGTRISMMVGFCAVIVSGILGTFFGILSGYLG